MRLSALARILGDAGFPAELEGEDREVHAVQPLEQAGSGDVAFVSNPKYLPAARATGASAVIAAPDVAVASGASVLRCKDPYAAVTVAIMAIHGHRQHPAWGRSDQAFVHPGARVGEGANLAPGSHVAEGAVLGDACTLYPGAFVGPRARLGADCVLFPNAVVYDDCVLGDRVILHAGTVIGQDGVGFAPVGQRWLKIPQVGQVVIGDDVELGANCAVDRSALGRTEIGSGSKFGNLVVVAHGAKVGANCMVVGQAGIAGTAQIGDNVTLAGQVGVAGHLTVGDRVRAAARAVILNDIPPDTEVIGFPAVEVGKGRRILLAQQKVPELAKRVRKLEKQLAALQAKLDE